MRPVIQVSGIRKRYGKTIAVAEASFDVAEGEIFGLIGPNGAGKTTTMECIEGLREPDGGSISVLGLDPFRQVYTLQKRIGVQLQQAQLQKRIKVHEAVDLWATLYQKTTADGERLLEQLGLTEKRNAWFMNLSGGQKQRLFIALALINDPEVVFLDELTTGLDPQSRRAIWDLVRGIRERGKTVFLTTHLMEEAERLCDRVAIMDHGKVIALGTPQQLIASVGGEDIVEFAVMGHGTGEGVVDAAVLKAIPGVQSHRVDAGLHQLAVSEPHVVVPLIFTTLTAQGLHLSEFRTHSATLEDVFVGLTGRNLRDE